MVKEGKARHRQGDAERARNEQSGGPLDDLETLQ
jgi:hypothetical protein